MSYGVDGRPALARRRSAVGTRGPVAVPYRRKAGRSSVGWHRTKRPPIHAGGWPAPRGGAPQGQFRRTGRLAAPPIRGCGSYCRPWTTFLLCRPPGDGGLGATCAASAACCGRPWASRSPPVRCPSEVERMMATGAREPAGWPVAGAWLPAVTQHIGIPRGDCDATPRCEFEQSRPSGVEVHVPCETIRRSRRGADGSYGDTMRLVQVFTTSVALVYVGRVASILRG